MVTMGADEDIDALERDPLGFIQSAFRRSLATHDGSHAVSDGDNGVRAIVSRLVASGRPLREINGAGGIERSRENELVRFRALVQDMYEPEYYIGAYVRKGDSEWTTTKYCEHIDVKGTIAQRALFERRVLYCVPVPGEQPWVGEAERVDETADEEGTRGEKREREETSMDVCPDATPAPRSAAMLIRPDLERTKKANAEDHMAPDTPEQIGEGEAREESIDQLLNFPLVPETRSPCIVKVYDDDDSLRLNDVVEFVGLLYYSPELTAAERDKEMKDDNVYATSSFIEEDNSKNPVSSLVPRFHALAYKVTSQNKFVNSSPVERFTATDLETSHGLTPEKVAIARGKLLDMIANALGGDHFAAELVLMALVSRVHTRTDLLSLGKFSLNLTGCKVESSEAGTIAHVLSSVLGIVCPSVAHLPLTVPSLNARPWAPRKDYVYNRLRAGPLQLAASTVLLLDETKLDSGTLTQIGVRNIESLKAISTVQDVEYDFEYHQMQMPVDIPLIILSDRKSIIPTDSVVPLRRVRNPKLIDATEEELTLMRTFIAGARMTKHVISEKTSVEIEAEIVEARKADAAITQESLHRMLTMTRLRALNYGQTELTTQTWKETIEINRRVAERARVI